MSGVINVEVVYALPEQQCLVALTLPEGSSAMDAVVASGLCDRFPQINTSEMRLGIFSRPITASTMLREHDRVEIYRGLIADPKASRRKRAEGYSSKKSQ